VSNIGVLKKIKLPLIISRLNHKKLKWILISIALILMLFMLLANRENIFTLNGQADSVTVTFSKNQLNQWNISGAKVLYNLDTLEELELSTLESYFAPKEGSTAVLSFRFNDQIQELFIVVTSESGSVGVIDDQGREIALGSYLEIALPLNKTRILPFDGRVRLGEDVAVGVENILLSGSVKIIEQQLIGEARYVAGEYSLDRGDRVELYLNEQLLDASQVKGFMRLTQGNPIEITSHGIAEVAKVERLGSAGYKISPSVWARLTNDPFIAALTTMFGTLFLFMEFSILVINLSANKKEKSE
jgi:hypothetical protein